MLVLIDTNVLIDSITKREPFCFYADKVIDFFRQEIINGAITGHSVSNAMYILRKNFSLPELKELFLSLCEFLHVEAVDFLKIIQASNDDTFSDFEDCLQEKCAINFKAYFIITRDVKDFKSSQIPAISLGNFCKLLEPEYSEEKKDCRQIKKICLASCHSSQIDRKVAKRWRR